MGLSPIEILGQGSPVVLKTLFRHYFNRKKSTQDSKARDELLYDEAFNVMKTMLEIFTKNTVEDLQRFSNTHLPSPPNILVLPLLIPLSTCHAAANHLIAALGGPEQARKVVGGSEWWQVRGLKGIEAEWIGVKKQFKDEENKAAKAHSHGLGGLGKGKGKGKAEDKGEHKEMTEEEKHRAYKAEGLDGMRCMLYIHGGAYYWGSINTHRYMIWRYARKMKGRAFAVNYRKSPQYPFPCALQDCLAAYLFLIDPPPNSKHLPIHPSQIVLAGDSAGGGLVLALLQVLRDANLPMPSGAIAISPWCDLTHCFPSVMENFATDVMPPYGFIHKPSTLWPPPTAELSDEVQGVLRRKVREAESRLRKGTGGHKAGPAPTGTLDDSNMSSSSSSPSTTHRGDTPLTVSTTSHKHQQAADTTHKGDELPSFANLDSSLASSQNTSSLSLDAKHKKHASRNLHPKTSGGDASEGGEELPPATTNEGKTRQNMCDPTDGRDMEMEIDGEKVVIRGQIQLYATNAQLPHPYVSPAFAYLGGLCPLLVIASDKELLRDEIIYVAHKAAYPDRFPIPDHVRDLMPQLADIESRYPPTKVHLQVYDETCHVLPLYSMTTPAKYCFRAIASFAKYVTPGPSSTSTSSATPARCASPLNHPPSPTHLDSPLGPPCRGFGSNSTSPKGLSLPLRSASASPKLGGGAEKLLPEARMVQSPKGSHDSLKPEAPGSSWTNDADEMTGPRFENGWAAGDGPETAGHPAVYDPPGLNGGMIRERVSTRGIIRPLEDEADLPALQVPFEELGMIKELPAKRYLTGQGLWDKKYHKAAKAVEADRRKNLSRAQKDGNKIWERVHKKHEQGKLARGSLVPDEGAQGEEEEEQYVLSGVKSWHWALKGENPPASAVVSRRDTDEARKLAKIADQTNDEEGGIGGVNLWSTLIEMLSPSSSSSSSIPIASSSQHRTPHPTTSNLSTSSEPIPSTTAQPATPPRGSNALPLHSSPPSTSSALALPQSTPQIIPSSPSSSPNSSLSPSALASPTADSPTNQSRKSSALRMPSFLTRKKSHAEPPPSPLSTQPPTNGTGSADDGLPPPPSGLGQAPEGGVLGLEGEVTSPTVMEEEAPIIPLGRPL